MAHKKAGGTSKNLTDSNPQYLGIKLYAGEKARVGSILVRQRGTRILPGKNTGIGKDHTIYAIKDGIVGFSEKRQKTFNNQTAKKKVVNIE